MNASTKRKSLYDKICSLDCIAAITRSRVILITPFVFIIERMYCFFQNETEQDYLYKVIKTDNFLLLEDIISWQERKNQF